eukprot:1877113-Pyramimonas_sp.AAC.3
MKFTYFELAVVLSYNTSYNTRLCFPPNVLTNLDVKRRIFTDCAGRGVGRHERGAVQPVRAHPRPQPPPHRRLLQPLCVDRPAGHPRGQPSRPACAGSTLSSAWLFYFYKRKPKT